MRVCVARGKAKREHHRGEKKGAMRCIIDLGCGAAGSALPWGGRGRKFKSCHSDQEEIRKNLLFSFVFSCFLAFSCV